MAICVAELEEKQTRAAAAAADAYRQLVMRMAAGEEVADKLALQTLREAGKTTADLQAELQRLERVQKLKAIVAEQPKVAARHREIGAELDAKKAEWETFSKRLEAECKALRDEQTTLRSRAIAIDNANRELRDLQPPPADEAALQHELRLLTAEVQRVEMMLGSRPDPDAMKIAAERHAARAAELQSEIEQAVGILGFTRRYELRSELNAVVQKRDEAAALAEKFAGTRHLCKRLQQLAAQRDELLQRQRHLRAERPDDE